MSEAGQLNEELGTASVIWKLEDIYPSPDSKAFVEDLSWCEREAADICAAYRGRVGSLSAEDLLDLVQRIEALEARLGRLSTYTFLRFSTKISDEAAGALNQEVHELANRCSKEIVFFELEWNLADRDYIETLLADPQLKHYRHYLDTLRRYLPHQLKENEEQLLLELRSVGRKSWTTLFEKVIGNLRFGTRGWTEEEVLSDLYHPERDIRKQAADDLTAGLKSQAHILSHVFNTLAAEKMITDRLRCYPTWVSAMNLDNQIHDRTVDSLVEAVTSRYGMVARYYRLKAGLLKLDKLYDYDRYAPLPGLPAMRIDWQRCRRIVLDSFSQFSNRLADSAERFFEQSWIHAPVMEGKRGGAFAHPCVPEVHPYVMVNYTGTLRDVSTVAHELGHGVHQTLAAANGYLNSNTPLALAETASVFAEFLVFKAQLALIADEHERRAFICQKLESIFATVFRQVALNRFERGMHEARRGQGELSSEQLGDIWLASQQEMFGSSVILRDDYRIWWSYIPHFLSTPGYVYSYAFGELLVLALYAIYQQEGNTFTDRYLDLLAAGGSASPYDLLTPFAIDLDDPAFWHQGLDLIDGMLSDIE